MIVNRTESCGECSCSEMLKKMKVDRRLYSSAVDEFLMSRRGFVVKNVVVWLYSPAVDEFLMSRRGF